MTLSGIVVKQKPSYIDEFLWSKALEKGRVKAKLHSFEKRCLKRNVDISPVEWASKNRIIQTGPLAGSFWSKTLTPYLNSIMEAAFLPCVRRVSICKSPQIGGSVLIETMLGYIADKVPGPCLVVFPNQETARKNCRERIRAVFFESPRLSSLFTSSKYNITDTNIRLPHMNITLGWAGSAISLGNITVKYLFLDELDKYVSRNKKEAPPDLLAEKRITAYPYDHKIIKNSTPTVESGVTWRSILNSHIFVYRVVCPSCKRPHVMNFVPGGTFIFDDKESPEELIQKKSVMYKCQRCGRLWDDGMRDMAVMDGYWTPGYYDEGTETWHDEGLRKQDVLRYIQKNEIDNVGFHIPAYISPFVSLSTIAAAFLRGEGDENARKDFYNNFKGEPWRPRAKTKKVTTLERLKDERPRGSLPNIDGNKIVAITAAIDTQDNGFFYELRAWSSETLTSWCVREGFVPFDPEGLLELIFETDYIDPNGEVLNTRLAVIDSGGHKTADVYDMCRGKYQGLLLPLKGVQHATQPFRVSTLDYYPGTQRKIKGGLGLWIIDTTYYKNLLSSKLDIKKDDPGAWLFHSEVTDEWLHMLTAEAQDESGNWIQKRKANHYWDLCVYQLFAADRLGIKFLKHPKRSNVHGKGNNQRANRKNQREKKKKGGNLW